MTNAIGFILAFEELRTSTVELAKARSRGASEIELNAQSAAVESKLEAFLDLLASLLDERNAEAKP